MKRLKAIALAALLWCIAGSVVAHAAQAPIELSSDRFVQQVDQDASQKQLLAQMNLLTGAGGKFKAASAASPPTFTFVSTVIPGGSGTNTISTAVANIGTANVNRRVYVFMAGGVGGRTITLANSFINSIPLSHGGQSAALNNLDSFWWGTAVVAAGTTGVAISFEFSNTQFGAFVFGIYTVDATTLLSPTPNLGTCADVSVANTTGSATAPTIASGSIISALITGVGNTGETISASDASLSVDAANINGVAAFGHANNTPVSASSNVTWTWNNSSNAGICNFAFR